MIVLATQLPGLQAGLLTTSLTGLQWLECVGLALVLPLVVEVSKWIRRRSCAGRGGRCAACPRPRSRRHECPGGGARPPTTG